MNVNPYAVPPTSVARIEDAVFDGPSGVDSRVRYRVVMLLTMAAALSYLVRNAVGVAESSIRTELGLSLSQSAWFLGAFFWTYALFQVPSGWLSQRRGTRWALTVFAVAWSIAACLVATAPGLALLIVAQSIMGIAQAGVFPAACNSIKHWMPLSRRSIACAVLATGMQCGAILSSMLTGPLLPVVGWRALFALYALPGFAWAAWFWWTFRDDPQRDRRVTPTELRAISGSDHADAMAQATEARSIAGVDAAGASPPLATPWSSMLGHPTLWFLCGQQTARAGGYMFFASWFPTYLQVTRGVSIAQSAYLQALVFAGTLLGSLWGGLLIDWIYRRTRNLRLSRGAVGSSALASCGLLILAAWFVSDPTLAVLLMAVGGLCAALAGPCAYAASIDVGGDYVPQVFGIVNMSGNLAAAVCPLAVAWLVHATGNWNLVLLVFAAIYVAGAACWLAVDPARKITAESL